MRGLDLTWQLLRPYGRYMYYQLFPSRRPRYFLNAWQFPPVAPGSFTGFTPPAFFFFPMNDWHGRKQRSQHLATALAQAGHLCIYINPHLGLEYLTPYAFSASSQARALERNLVELHVHLPREHEWSKRALLGSETDRILAATDGVFGPLAHSQIVLMVSSPVWIDVVLKLRMGRGFPIVYDCHDLLSGFPGMPRELLEAEDRLIRECDRIVLSSAVLRDKVLRTEPKFAPKAAVIRNGVNPADFGMAGRDPHRAARPIAGYMGALDSWFDCDSVREAAVRHPGVDFVLLGGIRDRHVLQLRSCANIHFLGEVPYAELKNHLANWSVATIPFQRNPLTLATNPIKLYEYFSAGLPVVATRLPELEPYSELIYLSDNPAEFATAVTSALSEPGNVLKARRLAVAQNETWAQRAQAFKALFLPPDQ